jgi:hypothetical protein
MLLDAFEDVGCFVFGQHAAIGYWQSQSAHTSTSTNILPNEPF